MLSSKTQAIKLCSYILPLTSLLSTSAWAAATVSLSLTRNGRTTNYTCVFGDDLKGLEPFLAYVRSHKDDFWTATSTDWQWVLRTRTPDDAMYDSNVLNNWKGKCEENGGHGQ
ncbi:hypothetical protein BCV70DRAFT_198671 [Testicularia cyperi]|uniref:Uncharacterized protein n=1 Tax=Testicularia cyperi TaxID=1882483 RepID=A0A317XYM6_9BASI|nr:hypothetical protein BCV70DRAFT_198671 [Testicularia cyperi]